MPRKSDAKQRMIDAALLLMQQRGVSAMGLLDVVAQADAPRGSIYHHFPGGKDELIIAALGKAAAQAEAAILKAGEVPSSPEQVTHRIAALFRYAPEKSQWKTGCPVAATAIEGDYQSEAVLQAVTEAFSRWSMAAGRVLQHAGLSEVQAQQMGLALIAALEGGLLMARGLKSSAPYDAAVEGLIAQLKALRLSRTTSPQVSSTRRKTA